MLEFRSGPCRRRKGCRRCRCCSCWPDGRRRRSRRCVCFGGQGLHLGDAGQRRRQRHRGRIVEQDVKVDIGRHLRARLRNALDGQRAHPQHLGEDRIDRGRVVDFDIAHERGRADGDRDRDLGRAGGQARDALGQAVEHRHGRGLGHCRAFAAASPGSARQARRRRRRRSIWCEFAPPGRSRSPLRRRTPALEPPAHTSSRHCRRDCATAEQDRMSTREGPRLSGLASPDETARALGENFRHQTTERVYVPLTNFVQFLGTAEDFVRSGPAFSPFAA